MTEEQYRGPEVDVIEGTLQMGRVIAGSLDLPEDDLEE